jgi:mortality factor 4-like protein 1
MEKEKINEKEFEEGEKVLAYHQSLIYEAKILKKEFRSLPLSKGGEMKAFYLVHYQGWKEKWDEWVDSSRLLEINEKK